MSEEITGGSYLFSLIEKINLLMPDWLLFLAPGKLILCLCVIIFFISLRRLFCLMLFFLFSKIFYKNEARELKQIFISYIKNPIGYTLLFYALFLCTKLSLYPQPVDELILKIFKIIFVLLFTWLILRILKSYGLIFISKIAEKSGRKEVINLIIKVLYFFIIIIALLLILSIWGFNISALIASLGIGGLALALAAKDIIANFFASILLLFDNSFEQGDWIEVGGVEGNVVEIGLRKTSIRTFDNALVFLPNSIIMNANIKNSSQRKVGRLIRMYLGIDYSADEKELKNCVSDIKNLLNTSPLVAHEDDASGDYYDHENKYRQSLVSMDDLEGYKNDCHVALHSFSDNGIKIELYFFTRAIGGKDFRAAREELMLEIMKIIKKHKLSFAASSQNISLLNKQ